MKPSVLVLSGLYDFSTDRVCLNLSDNETQFLRINKEQIANCRVSLNPNKQQLTVHQENCTYSIDRTLKSVWYRQPIFLRNTPAKPLSPQDQLERSQWMAFLRALSVLSDAAWMNFPSQTYLAESKPYQLYAAENCGFRIPATLVSNDADEIRACFPHTAIIKSLDTVLIQDGEDCLFTYTTLSNTNELTSEIVGSAPLLVQEHLNPKVDIRVTMVGEKHCAVKILSKKVGIEGDWRTLPRENIEYVDIDLPLPIAYSCHALMKLLGLSFGAIDLIETPEGIFFIEINPTGEWGWLCSSERPIDIMIGSWLRNPPVQVSDLYS